MFGLKEKHVKPSEPSVHALLAAQHDYVDVLGKMVRELVDSVDALSLRVEALETVAD